MRGALTALALATLLSTAAAATAGNDRVVLRLEGCDGLTYQTLICHFEGELQAGFAACANNLADRLEELVSEGHIAPFCSARVMLIATRETTDPLEVADWLRR